MSDEIYRATYPFVRSVYNTIDWDGEASIPTWRPGVMTEHCGPDGAMTINYAHGVGEVVYTVVSRHKPGRYPERVFYTRKWIDPDGKEFGNPKLRVTTNQAFADRIRGYVHEYEIDENADAEAA